MHRLGLRRGVAHDNLLLDLLTVIVGDSHVLDFTVSGGLRCHVKIVRHDLDVALLCISIADGDFFSGWRRGQRKGCLWVDGLARDGTVTGGLKRFACDGTSRHSVVVMGSDVIVYVNFGVRASNVVVMNIVMTVMMGDGCLWVDGLS